MSDETENTKIAKESEQQVLGDDKNLQEGDVIGLDSQARRNFFKRVGIGGGAALLGGGRRLWGGTGLTAGGGP